MIPRRLLLLLIVTGFSLPLSSAFAQDDVAANFHFGVVDATNQQPIAGAEISLSADDLFADRLTGDNGQCAFRLKKSDPKLLAITVKAKGYVTTQVRWRNRGKTNTIPNHFTLNLAPAQVIGGRVVTSDGNPICLATVSPRLIERLSPPRANPQINTLVFNTPVKTDTDGKWSYDNAPASLSDLELSISAEGFLTATLNVAKHPALADALKAQREVTQLSSGVKLTGTVINENGQPIVGANVRIDARKVAGLPAGSMRTGPGGAFSFATIQPGDVTITASAPGHSPLLQRLDITGAGEADPLTLALGRGHVVEGTVVDQMGAPIAKATIVTERWRGQSTLNHIITTDAKGQFHWGGAPADTVDFHISADGCKPLRLFPLKIDTPQTVTLDRRQVVWGHITSATDDEPVDNFIVQVGLVPSGGGTPVWKKALQQQCERGFYQLTLPATDQHYALKFTADGLQPLQTPPLSAQSGLTEMNYALQPME